MDVVELTPRLHFLRLPVGHAYLWRDTDGLTLIDSGAAGSAESIDIAIRGLGHRPTDLRRLVLTHFHEDHIGSAAEIAGWGAVTVCAHRRDAPVIRGEVDGPPPVLADWERTLLEQIRSQTPSVPPAPVRVDRELDDGDILDFGGGARVVAVPGHTPGSVAIHLPEHRVLFTGDAIARRPDGDVMLGPFNVDPGEAAESYRRLAALDVDTACFGHGEPVVGGAADRIRAADPGRG